MHIFGAWGFWQQQVDDLLTAIGALGGMDAPPDTPTPGPTVAPTADTRFDSQAFCSVQVSGSRRRTFTEEVTTKSSNHQGVRALSSKAIRRSARRYATLCQVCLMAMDERIRNS